MATQNAINIGDSARCFTGAATWGGAGVYFVDSTPGSFTVSRPGTGFIKGKPVAWAGSQTTTGLTAGNCYYICIDSSGLIYKTTSDATAYSGDYIPLFECMVESAANTQITVREDHPYNMPYLVNHYLHDSIGPIIENHSKGANITLKGTQQITISGADVLLDHGLSTDIADTGSDAVTFNKMYTNAPGSGSKWCLYSATATFTGHYNNAGTVTALDTSKFAVYTLYVSKDNLNSSSPTYYAVLDTSQYSNQAAAQTAIGNGSVAAASNELAALELCKLGYIIYSKTTPNDTIVQVIIAKSTFQSSVTTTGTNAASLVSTSTTAFDGFLSATDTNVQAALNTLDEWGKMTDGYLLIGRTGTSPVKATLTAGAGITITPASGAITVAYNGGSGSVSTLTGDSGGAISPSTGNITIAGGTGLTSSGSGSTITIDLDAPVSIANGGTNANSMANNYGTVYYNGTSLGTVAPGSQDYVLTSNGASAAPSYQLVPGTLAWSTTSSTAFTAVANKGYILTSTSEPVVTMPSSPSVGDSIGVIKIVTGGFKIAQAASQKTYFSTAGVSTAGTGHGIESSTLTALYRKVVLTYVATNSWYVTDQIGTFLIY